MLRTRTHLITFCVTDDELKRLKIACDRHGARCLSDLARSVMLSSLTNVESSRDEMLDLDRHLFTLVASHPRLVNAEASSIVELAASER